MSVLAVKFLVLVGIGLFDNERVRLEHNKFIPEI